MPPIVVPTSLTPTLSDLMGRVRLDLFDAGQRAGDQPRWTDQDLARSLDRAVDRYSTIAPYLKEALLPTTPYSRLYPLPADAWWVDAAEFPYGQWPKWFQPVEEKLSALVTPPTAASSSAAFSPSGHLSAGTYAWMASFVVPGGGETTAAPIASGVAQANQRAALTLPLGPYGVSDRRLYRTAANGGAYTLVGSAGDNVTTTFVDSASDSAIASNPAPPAANTTQGIRQFELQISDAKLPEPQSANGADPNYGWIGLRYAAKHELDANGTTIPERHWDAVCLGAAFFAVFAYLIPTADNFHYVDGQFRDQVDDTKVTAAWMQVGTDMENRLLRRLDQIKSEINSGVAAIGSWGDKPERWDRL